MLRSSEIDTVRSGFRGRSFSVSWFWRIDWTCMASTTLLPVAVALLLSEIGYFHASIQLYSTCRSSGSAKQFVWVVLSCMSSVDPTLNYLQMHLQQTGHRARHKIVHVFENFCGNSTVEITRQLACQEVRTWPVSQWRRRNYFLWARSALSLTEPVRRSAEEERRHGSAQPHVHKLLCSFRSVLLGTKMPLKKSCREKSQHTFCIP